MASRPDKRLWHAAWLVVIALASGACGTDEVVSLETVDLADGEFYGLSWGGTQVERFHVLARPGPRGETDPDSLVLISPQHEEPCDLGKVQRYYTQQPRSGSKYVLGSPSPARIALFDGIDEHGFGTLSFADIDCKRTDLTVPDLESGTLLRIYPPDLEQLLLGVRDRERTVSLVDPWKDGLLEVARNVDNVWPTDNAAWFLEDGELVKRDLSGRERRRFGKQVTSFTQLGSDSEFAYVDGGTLFVEHSGKRTELAHDLCDTLGAVRALDGFIPGALAFYSPCDARRLTIVPAVGKPFAYDLLVRDYFAQRGQLFVVTSSDTSTTIRTAVAHDPGKLLTWVELPPMQIQSIWPVRSGRWLVLGQEPDESWALWRATDAIPSAEPQTVVSGADSIVNAQRAVAWLRDGKLTVRDQSADATFMQDDAVGRFSFVFPGQSLAVTYLTNIDPMTGLGRLELRFLNGDSFTLAREVREYREVWWPERGILYARGGSRAGVKFARVQIPCSQTSDSPWACGF
jgi:hypothetical protein